jgi:hypothetical protein
MWVTLQDNDVDEIILNNIALPRRVFGYRFCRGFRRHLPGRSPSDHLKLEDENRQFRRQLLIAIVSFIGALLGALIGGLLGRKH